MNFSELGLSAAIIKSLDENKISTPSEIQEKVIPFILTTSKNLVAVSQTGTGKTAAFGLPILQKIDPQLQQTQVLVMVPTRELAQQVAKDLFVFSRYIVRIHTEAVYGGKKIEEQLKKLEIPRHIIVATPGRLLDLLERKIIDLSYLKFLVLDEADEMLNMGFKPDIDKIVRACNTKVRKFLFTSTLPAEIKQTVRQYMGDKVDEIHIKPQEFVNRNIEHQYIAYKYGYKLEFLKAFLLNHSDERGIIFCRTQAAAKLLGQQLAGFSIKADSLYGDLNQFERNKVMAAFKAQRIQILIATDIAARGIDVQDLNFVVHYHLPDNDAQYVNRSGRTGRAGKTGRSICMLQEDEIFQKEGIETSLHIQFVAIKMDVVIDKSELVPVELTINIGTRHELDGESVKNFLSAHSGIKKEAISEIQVYRAETTFVIDTKYQSQVVNNLHNTRHFHQRILVEKSII
ncbi:MAG TPA: DEAD/DEAH box helicase [Cytophagaceae bacterium]|nr:DEAD/DEAH box helicase [Cytophagaceae bacterium]